MTDEEIKQYIDAKINEFKNSAIDIASLPQAEPDDGTTLPFVKQQQLVSALVSSIGGGGSSGSGETIPSILLSELDNLNMDAVHGNGDSIYKVMLTEGGFSVGILQMFSDNMAHVATQVFITHYTDPGTWLIHNDDEVYIYYRSYAMQETTAIPQGTWSQWRNFILPSIINLLPGFATSSKYGTVKLGTDTVQPVLAQAAKNMPNRSYPIQKDSDGKLVVNVPWESSSIDTTGLEEFVNASIWLIENGSLSIGQSQSTSSIPGFVSMPIKISVNYQTNDETINKFEINGYVPGGNATTDYYGSVRLGSNLIQQTVANGVTDISGRTYSVQNDSNGRLVVNVPWENTSVPMLIFDGIEDGEITILDSTAAEFTDIIWSSHNKKFAAKTADGQYYSNWPRNERYDGNMLEYEDGRLFALVPKTIATAIGFTNSIYARYSKKLLGTNFTSAFEKIAEVNITYSNATPSADGLMSKEDKAKLDSISEAGLIPTVSIYDLDGMIEDLQDILNGKKSSIYHVSQDGKNVGILEIAGDEMMHQITQRLYGNFTYTGGSQTSNGKPIIGNLDKTSHTDGAPTTMFRVFNLSSATADTGMFPKGQWSMWYNEYIFGVEGVYTSDSALSTSEIEEAINSLG